MCLLSSSIQCSDGDKLQQKADMLVQDSAIFGGNISAAIILFIIELYRKWYNDVELGMRP